MQKDKETGRLAFGRSRREFEGPVLPKTKKEAIVIGANEVTVPSAYHKVIYDRTPHEKIPGFFPTRRATTR